MDPIDQLAILAKACPPPKKKKSDDDESTPTKAEPFETQGPGDKGKPEDDEDTAPGEDDGKPTVGDEDEDGIPDRIDQDDDADGIPDDADADSDEDDGDEDDDGIPDDADADSDEGDEDGSPGELDFGAAEDGQPQLGDSGATPGGALGNMAALVQQIAEAEKTFYANKGMHGAGHHKAEGAMHEFHKLVRKLVRAVGVQTQAPAGADSHSGEQSAPAFGSENGEGDESVLEDGANPDAEQGEGGDEDQRDVASMGEQQKKPNPFEKKGESDNPSDDDEDEKKKKSKKPGFPAALQAAKKSLGPIGCDALHKAWDEYVVMFQQRRDPAQPAANPEAVGQTEGAPDAGKVDDINAGANGGEFIDWDKFMGKMSGKLAGPDLKPQGGGTTRKMPLPKVGSEEAPKLPKEAAAKPSGISDVGIGKMYGKQMGMRPVSSANRPPMVTGMRPQSSANQMRRALDPIDAINPLAKAAKAKKKAKHPVSKAQRRWAFAAEERGELPKGKALEWSRRVKSVDPIDALNPLSKAAGGVKAGHKYISRKRNLASGGFIYTYAHPTTGEHHKIHTATSDMGSHLGVSSREAGGAEWSRGHGKQRVGSGTLPEVTPHEGMADSHLAEMHRHAMHDTLRVKRAQVAKEHKRVAANRKEMARQGVEYGKPVSLSGMGRTANPEKGSEDPAARHKGAEHYGTEKLRVEHGSEGSFHGNPGDHRLAYEQMKSPMAPSKGAKSRAHMLSPLGLHHAAKFAAKRGDEAALSTIHGAVQDAPRSMGDWESHAHLREANRIANAYGPGGEHASKAHRTSDTAKPDYSSLVKPDPGAQKRKDEAQARASSAKEDNARRRREDMERVQKIVNKKSLTTDASGRPLSKGLYAFQNANGAVVPDKYLYDYLCAFIEEACEHERHESAHKNLTAANRNGDMARAVMHEFIATYPNNANLRAAAKKFNVTAESIETIIRDKGMLPVPADAITTDADSHAAMNAQFAYSHRNLNPGTGRREQVDLMAKAGVQLAKAAPTVQLKNDAANPLETLKQHQSAQHRSLWAVPEAPAVAGASSACPQHGLHKASRTMVTPRCTCAN